MLHAECTQEGAIATSIKKGLYLSTTISLLKPLWLVIASFKAATSRLVSDLKAEAGSIETREQRTANAEAGPSAEEYHRVIMGLMAADRRQAALQVRNGTCIIETRTVFCSSLTCPAPSKRCKALRFP